MCIVLFKEKHVYTKLFQSPFLFYKVMPSRKNDIPIRMVQNFDKNTLNYHILTEEIATMRREIAQETKAIRKDFDQLKKDREKNTSTPLQKDHTQLMRKDMLIELDRLKNTLKK